MARAPTALSSPAPDPTHWAAGNLSISYLYMSTLQTIFWIYRDELPRRNKVCLMLPQGQNLVFASVCQLSDEMCRQGLGGYNLKLGSCKSGEESQHLLQHLYEKELGTVNAVGTVKGEIATF